MSFREGEEVCSSLSVLGHCVLINGALESPISFSLSLFSVSPPVCLYCRLGWRELTQYNVVVHAARCRLARRLRCSISLQHNEIAELAGTQVDSGA